MNQINPSSDLLMNGQVMVGDSVGNKASYKIEEELRMVAEPEAINKSNK